jgi:hypothetical protein
MVKGAISIRNTNCNNFHFLKIQNKLQAIYYGMPWINMEKKQFIVVQTFKGMVKEPKVAKLQHMTSMNSHWTSIMI